MSSTNLLVKIKELADVDAAVLRIISERKKLQKEFDTLTQEIEKLQKELVAIHEKNTSAKSTYDRETANVKAEREKLAARRRALATLGNYKLQEAASKEINASEKEVSAHEDTLVNLLDSSEQTEKIVAEKELLLLDKEEAKVELLKDMQPTLDSLKEREGKHMERRVTILQGIDARELSIYDGVRKKLAPDVLSPIVSGACDFCNLQTPHQMVIQVSAGTSLQKCRGCSRILYLPPEA